MAERIANDSSEGPGEGAFGRCRGTRGIGLEALVVDRVTFCHDIKGDARSQSNQVLLVTDLMTAQPSTSPSIQDCWCSQRFVTTVRNLGRLKREGVARAATILVRRSAPMRDVRARK